MKTVDYKLNSIRFHQTELTLEKGAIIVIVGPNNSGKTTILDEIECILKYPKEKMLNIEKIDSSIVTIKYKELDDYFVKELNLLKNKDYGTTEYKGFGTNIREMFLNEDTELKESWISAFVLNVDTLTRLQVVEPTNNISLTQDPYTHPIHYLLRSEDLERQPMRDLKEILNFEIVLHLFASQKIHLLIGKKPIDSLTRYKLTKAYDEMIELADQGDGIKAYIGVLLTLLAAVQKVILVDEPENFLHPPQALKLGKTIGHYSLSKEKQIFISTHSSDLLKGLLEANHMNLQLLRINRDHSIKILENSICKAIWDEDPIIKCSNLLDGLFHDLVIICESDVDAKFYSLLLDQIDINLDVMFCPSYGKEKIIKMRQILDKLGIENKCIVDFDAISDKNFIQNISKVTNLNYNSIKVDYEPIFHFLKDKSKEDIKRAGKQIISNQFHNNYKNFIDTFKNHEIYFVEVGELERFVQSKNGKSGKWLFEVINDFETLLMKRELNTAIEFLKDIVSTKIIE